MFGARLRRCLPDGWVYFAVGAMVVSSCASVPTVEVAAGSGIGVGVGQESALDEIGGNDDSLGSETSPDVDGSETDAAESGSADGRESASPTTEPEPLAGGVDPETLLTTPDGAIAVQETPIELQDRSIETVDVLPPPATDTFEFTIAEFAGEPLERSTWKDDCPVDPDGLRYLNVSFWGFDGRPHTGELIVAAEEADGVVNVFRDLHSQRFPIEEMRIITDDDLTEKPTGDGNNTASYVCRAVTGGSRYSEHSFGLAIDINPFQNPYVKDEIVIPELAMTYLERDRIRPGMLEPDDIVVWAFEQIGWSWGGDWITLKDYQHFARNNR